MRLKIAKGEGSRLSLQVEVWVDVANDRSCGESRSDWQRVATVGLRELLAGAYRLTYAAQDEVNI